MRVSMGAWMGIATGRLASPVLAQEEGGSVWLQFLGRLHVVAVHFPIALILVGCAAEVVSLAVRRRGSSLAVWCVGIGAVSACVAAWFGWLYADFDPPGASKSELLLLHRWFGVGGAIAACVALATMGIARAVGTRGATAVSVGVLIVTSVAIGYAGHLGGSMVQGPGHLTEVFRRPTAEPVRPDPVPQTTEAVQLTALEREWAERVGPILVTHCAECHGERRAKGGGLRLHTLSWALVGSDAGPVVVAGEPERSELIRRVTLPPSDPDFMPEDGEPLSEEEIAALRAWVEGLDAAEAERIASGLPPIEEVGVGALPVVEVGEDVRAGIDRAIAALEARGAVVDRVAQDTAMMHVNLSLIGDVTDEDVALLSGLEPVLEQLNLARTGVTDRGVRELARFTNLKRLHLERTGVTDEGVTALAGLPLEYLNLYGTAVTDRAVEALAKISTLRGLYLWQTGVTGDGVERLRAALPEATVDIGETAAEAPVEVTEIAVVLPGCCQAAKEAGKECDHACCVEARGKGEVCRKCLGGGSSDESSES